MTPAQRLPPPACWIRIRIQIPGPSPAAWPPPPGHQRQPGLQPPPPQGCWRWSGPPPPPLICQPEQALARWTGGQTEGPRVPGPLPDAPQSPPHKPWSLSDNHDPPRLVSQPQSRTTRPTQVLRSHRHWSLLRLHLGQHKLLRLCSVTHQPVRGVLPGWSCLARRPSLSAPLPGRGRQRPPLLLAPVHLASRLLPRALHLRCCRRLPRRPGCRRETGCLKRGCRTVSTRGLVPDRGGWSSCARCRRGGVRRRLLRLAAGRPGGSLRWRRCWTPLSSLGWR